MMIFWRVYSSVSLSVSKVRCREDGVLEICTSPAVTDEFGKACISMYSDGQESPVWEPVRAALRYVTQRPWTRLPPLTRTLVFNPVLACLAGGRNKMLAAKAYDIYNAEIAHTGLTIHTPETIWDVAKPEVPLWVGRMGGLAVVKVPYANAGQGVWTITHEKELHAFMSIEHRYDRFIVQVKKNTLKFYSCLVTSFVALYNDNRQQHTELSIPTVRNNCFIEAKLPIHVFSVTVPSIISPVIWWKRICTTRNGFGSFNVLQYVFKSMHTPGVCQPWVVVQALIGNNSWSSVSQSGRLYHVGTIPNLKGNIYAADLRFMIGSSPEGFFPVAIYARRARLPLAEKLDAGTNSWDVLGTNLSFKVINILPRASSHKVLFIHKFISQIWTKDKLYKLSTRYCHDNWCTCMLLLRISLDACTTWKNKRINPCN